MKLFITISYKKCGSGSNTKNTTSIPVNKEFFNEVALCVQKFIDKNIELPKFFNNDGVFRCSLK
ncbi:MAG: hypothetical protein CM15mP108_2650 [Gammaproteobacteria bacterium]|nr:MAG: hypothetical protein CM15mP108_2650 [Gammaproteobacteria bacterium]